MSLFRTATNSSRLINFFHQNQGLASLPRHSLKNFSIETSEPSQDTPADTFLRTPSTGLVYGRLLHGIRMHTTKTDILNLLDECNLSLDDIKVDYNALFTPMSMIIQFPSQQAHDAAVRSIGRKGRLFRLEWADRAQWDYIAPYDEKAVVLRGIPRQASSDDIERFLSGCQYDASSVQMFFRQTFPDPIRMALVRFPSQALAMHAFITKNRGFCQNNQILVQVLH